jgi:hypothetical protein
MTNDELTIEPTGSHDGDPCSCCGMTTRRVWGVVSFNGDAHAAYYVRWTLGRVDHGAAFDLIVGEWGEDTGPDDRALVSLEFRKLPSGPSFMVTDARDWADAKDLASTSFQRDDVIGTPIAKMVFDIIDAIWFNDERLDELKQ